MTRPLAGAAGILGAVLLVGVPGVARRQEPPLPDARTFLADAVRLVRSNDLVRSRYTFTEQETRYSYDSSGRVVRKQVRVYEVRPSPEPELTYRRLVKVNGVEPKDLARRDAEQKRKEEAWAASRGREGENARAARLRRAAEEDQRERAVVDELQSIYDFRLTGRETIDGRAAITFEFDPHPGYSPKTPEGRILNHFRGKAWIDEADRELVRLRVDCLESVSVKFGFIFRLLKGSRGFIERRKIDGEAWLPTYSRFTGSGRVFFIARVDLDQESEYSAYRRITPAQ
jgi:YD repeat-containing protein